MTIFVVTYSLRRHSFCAVKTSNIAELTKHNAVFVDKELNNAERTALRVYTGGSYQTINAAICGRDGTTVSVVAGSGEAGHYQRVVPRSASVPVRRGRRALSGQERLVYDQNLDYVEEESARHRRKGEARDD